MNQNNESLNLATQVLQEQLSLLSDTPEGVEIDYPKTKQILGITKQIINVEKIRSDREKHNLVKQQFVYKICRDVSKGIIRHIPKAFQDDVKMLE